MCVRKYATKKISGILKKKIKTISEMEARTGIEPMSTDLQSAA